MSIIVENRKVRFDYEILETVEAGLVLLGSEVKAIRSGKVNIIDGFMTLKKGEPYVLNMNISQYNMVFAGQKHDPLRDKKLLLNKFQIKKFFGKLTQKGLTIVPLNIHTKGGKIKMEIALVKGKKLHDKRQALKERDLARMDRKEMRE